MTTTQNRITQSDWGAGVVRSVTPDLIPENGSFTLANLLLNIDGTAYERGGTEYVSTAVSDGNPLNGIWNGILGGSEYTFIAATDKFAKLGADGVTPTGLGGTGLRAATSMVAFLDSLYVGGGVRFDGSTISTLPADVWSQSYAVCQNRLVWVVAPNKIRFSEINNPLSFTNSLGTVNEHTIPGGGEITGLATVGANLLIFTTRGTWVLAGLAFDLTDPAGNPLHRLQVYSPDLILWDQGGIASWESLAIVPATNGVYLVDGVSTPVRLSQAIDPLLASYVAGPYRTGQAAVYGSHYFLPIIKGTTAKNLLVCRLDRTGLDRRRHGSFPWSFLTGAGAQLGALTVRVRGGDLRTPVLLGAEMRTSSRVLDCSAYFTPDAAHRTDAAGAPVLSSLVTRDFILNALGEAVPRKLRATYEMADAGEAPTMTLEYGDGTLHTGTPTWGGGGTWGTGTWASGDDARWTTVADSSDATVHAPASDGKVPFSWRFRRQSDDDPLRRRKLRLRFRRQNASARCVYHDLELFSRPSADVRRAR